MSTQGGGGCHKGDKKETVQGAPERGLPALSSTLQMNRIPSLLGGPAKFHPK